MVLDSTPSSTNGDPNAPLTAESPRLDSSDSTPFVSISQDAEPALDLHAIAAAAIRATARRSHEEESFARSIPGPVPVHNGHNEPLLQTGDVRPRFESLPTQTPATPKESCQRPPPIDKPHRINPASTPTAPASGVDHTSQESPIANDDHDVNFTTFVLHYYLSAFTHKGCIDRSQPSMSV